MFFVRLLAPYEAESMFGCCVNRTPQPVRLVRLTSWIAKSSSGATCPRHGATAGGVRLSERMRGFQLGNFPSKKRDGKLLCD
jgi:hypothetical protein